ncbi:MAG: diaminopimelate decarboxylase [Acidimicrobiia bacterium]
MTALPGSLLPDNATVSQEGSLAVAGCDLLALAEEYGTPLFVYDEDHMRARCREAVAAFPDGVAYAAKAFLCQAMAKLAYEEGMHLDVATGGEVHIALAAGVPAESLVFHGNNKSMAELHAGLSAEVGRVVVDSFDEIDRIETVVGEGLAPPRVLIRVTPGIEAHTHEYLQTGVADSKFGFSLAGGVAEEALARAERSPAMQLMGIHAHIGSQVFVVDSFVKAIGLLAPLVQSIDASEFSIGGGLGVAYVEGESTPSITEWAEAVKAAADATGIRSRILAEPGRAIVAAAAITLYRVGTLKRLKGGRIYAAVDGGMSDNPRPVLYGSGYEAFLPRSVEADRHLSVRVVGKHCESGDVIVRDAAVPEDLQVGDVLATPVTGAYGHSMGSNYNMIMRPPVVFVRDGRARVVVRRETYDDLVRRDV